MSHRKPKWLILEDKVTKYLNNNYKNYHFVHLGKSDSNSPDICAYQHGKKQFNVEVKSQKARAGQFAVSYRHNKLKISNKDIVQTNRTLLNLSIHILNLRHNKENLTSQYATKLIYDWIIQFYLMKKNKYFATKFHRRFLIFPIQHLRKYYQAYINIRRKKSGSSPVGVRFSHENDVLQQLKDTYHGMAIRSHKHFYIRFTRPIKHNIYLHNRLFINRRPVKNDLHEVRKRSRTMNLTVVFGIIQRIHKLGD